MLKAAATVGIPARRAYSMTPLEIWIEAYGFNERRAEDYRTQLRIAHTTAYLSRCDAKKFPKRAEDLFPVKRKKEGRKEQGARIRGTMEMLMQAQAQRKQKKKAKK